MTIGDPSPDFKSLIGRSRKLGDYGVGGLQNEKPERASMALKVQARVLERAGELGCRKHFANHGKNSLLDRKVHIRCGGNGEQVHDRCDARVLVEQQALKRREDAPIWSSR